MLARHVLCCWDIPPALHIFKYEVNHIYLQWLILCDWPLQDLENWSTFCMFLWKDFGMMLHLNWWILSQAIAFHHVSGPCPVYWKPEESKRLTSPEKQGPDFCDTNSFPGSAAWWSSAYSTNILCHLTFTRIKWKNVKWDPCKILKSCKTFMVVCLTHEMCNELCWDFVSIYISNYECGHKISIIDK